MSAGSSDTAFSGTASTTRSAERTASSTLPALAPVSRTSGTSEAGPRELATVTSWSSAVSRRVRVPPMLPAPMIPIRMPGIYLPNPAVSPLSSWRRPTA